MESKVTRDGLGVVLTGDRLVDAWLRKDVAAACDALKADPLRAVTGGTVKERLLGTRRTVDLQT